MVSPVFVGRAAGLDRVAGVLRQVALGEPAVVLVAGEAGVGKSRFVAELLARRAPPGARVLAGQCSGFAPGSLPYAPIAGALRQLLRSSEDEEDLLGEAGQAVGLLLPELTAAGQAAGAGGPVALDQGRMFAQLEAVLDKVSASAPLLLVIEDLHWADRSSLEFLAYLCYGLGWQRLAIVCTYRDDEVPAVPELGAWLADLRRGTRLTEVSLPRFTVAELGEQVAAILGEAADPGLVAALHARSGGNPYYTEMLLSAAAPAGAPGGAGTPPAALPAALREVLLARSAGTAAGTREVLAVIAAAGHPVAHGAVAAAWARLGMGEESLLAGLREAADRHLLVPVTDLGGYAFRHALLAEAIYDQLLPGERGRLHDAWAGVLEERVTGGGKAGPAAAAEVAAHHHKAGHPGAAFGWDLRAAEAAEQVGGVAEAAGCYRRMLAAWDDVRDAEQQAGFDRIDLLARLARAEELAGDLSLVRAHLQDAIALVDPVTDPLRAAMLQVRLCWSLYLNGRPAAALGPAAAAVALVPESPPSLARVGVLARLGGLQFLLGRGGRAAATAAAAAAVADQIPDPIAAALIAELQARVAWLTGRPGAVALARRAVRLGQQAGVRDRLCIRSTAWRMPWMRPGMTGGCCRPATAATSRPAASGAPIMVPGCCAGPASPSWRAAVPPRPPRRCTRPCGSARPGSWRSTGSWPPRCWPPCAATLRPDGRRSAGAGALPPSRCPSLGGTARRPPNWSCGPGDPDRAFTAAAEGLAAVDRTDYRRHAGTLAWLALRAAADRADLARARHDTAAEDQARADADQLPRTWSDPPWLTAEPDKPRPGPARPARRRAIPRRRPARPAAVGPRRPLLACLPPAAPGRLRGLAPGRSPARPARPPPGRGRLPAHRLRHRPRHRRGPAAARDRDAGPLRQNRPPTAPPSDDTPPVPAALQALTRREREILDQLAAGLTNRQIAERLYISPRTAAVHVSSVLHKLGVPDRVQAAHLARKLHGQ